MTTRPSRRIRHTEAGMIRAAMAKARDRANAAADWLERADVDAETHKSWFGCVQLANGRTSCRWLHPSLYPFPLDETRLREHRISLNLDSNPPKDSPVYLQMLATRTAKRKAHNAERRARREARKAKERACHKAALKKGKAKKARRAA